MAKVEDFRCPNCGAPLAIEGDRPTVRCPFCSTQVIVPPELRPRPPEPVQVVTPPPSAPTFQPAAEPVSRKSKTSPLGCVLLVVGILAMGVLSQVLRDSSSGSSLVEAQPTPTATVEPIQRDLSASLPRTLHYSGFTIQINRGVIDNRVKDGDLVSYSAKQAFARLDITLTNTTRENLYLDGQLFKLKLGDGKVYGLDGSAIINSTFVAPDPGSTHDTALIFQVPMDAQWENGELLVGTADYELEDMPLTGTAPAQQYPQQVAVPEGAQAAAQDISYQLLGAMISLDSGSHRVAKGSRFLILAMRMTNAKGKYGANVSSDNFRLAANGVNLAPVSSPIQLIEYQASADGEVVFAIPAGTKQVTLQVGDVRSETGQVSIPLDLSTAAAPTAAP